MVALAPGIGALVGIGAMALGGGVWARRHGRPGQQGRPPEAVQQRLGWAGRSVTATTVLVTAVWSYILLDRTPDWLPWLRWVVLVAGVLSAIALLTGPWLARASSFRRLVLLPVGLAMVAGLAGPAAYVLDTVNTAHTGAIPSAGPATVGFGGGPGGGGGFAGTRPGGTRPGGTAANGFPGGQFGGPGGSSGTQAGGTGTGASRGTGGTGAASGTGRAGAPGGLRGTRGTGRGLGGAGGTRGPAGGLGGNTQVSGALTKLLEQDASSYKWVAATEGSEEAAPLELATGDAVMAIGGFNGTDPWPTLAVFKELVAKHEVHYYVGQGSQSFGGGHGSSAIASWVAAHFTKETVGGQTVYDLTQPFSAS
ncbi:MAG TPA: hypothetical protein VKG61_23745, partial [Streptosporangiaceae bacterium]|nr:hypothetical protein [Streptosporangiaceae bacterium]